MSFHRLVILLLVSALLAVVGGAGIPILGSFRVTSAGAATGWPYAQSLGFNGVGQLGDGTVTNRPSPVQVQNVTNVSILAGGSNTSFAVTSAGIVYAWGQNAGTQLGNYPTPVLVPTLSNVLQLSAGNGNQLALESDGTVWTWGDDQFGELGNGTGGAGQYSLTPVQVPGLNGIIKVAAGWDFDLALASDGTVWAWGRNNQGQLGIGTTVDQAAPVQVSGLTSVATIAGGDWWSMATKTDGTVWTWGYNNFGQLGNGSTNNSSSPAQVSGISSVRAITAGQYHAVVQRNDGTLWAWGYNGLGQLGNNSTVDSHTPIQVSAPSNITAISASGFESLARRSDGTVWAWGNDANGQSTGNGTIQSSVAVPTALPTISGATVIGAAVSWNLIADGVPLALPPASGSITTSEMPGSTNPSEACSPCAVGKSGDPVNTMTGAFSESYKDIQVTGRGPGLAFNRTYNASLASTNGPLGYGWSFNYGMSLAINGTTGVVTVTQEDGSQIQFQPSGGTYTAPARVMATLIANGNGTYSMTRRARTRFTFSAAGQLTAITDLNGYLTTLVYNGSNQLATATDSSGRTLSFGYAGSNLTSITDTASPPRSVQFAYNDGQGNLTDVTDVGGGVTHFGYDANHRMVTVLDPNQAGSQNPVPLTNHYDANGRVDWQSDMMGRKTTFSYATNQTTITDQKGNIEVDTYLNGEMTAVTKGAGTAVAATISYVYDPNTLALVQATDPDGNRSTMTWDSAGNLLSSTNALGHTTSYTYDALNDVLTSEDPNLVTTTFAYDGAGNLLSETTPLVGSSPAVSQTTTYTYGDVSHPGDVTAMTDPDNKTWSYSYNANGDRTSVTDPAGNETTYGYDNVGRMTDEVLPSGNVTGGNPSAHTMVFATNGFGRRTSQTDPLNHSQSWLYDADQNLISYTDADNHTTTYKYDLDNELNKTIRTDQTTLQYGYDTEGNQASQTDGKNNATTYVFDASGRLSSMTDPLMRTTNYGHDAAGNVTTITDPAGNITTTAYDAANEKTSVSYSDGKTPNVQYTYDPDGQRLTMVDATGTTRNVWDSLHRLTSVTSGSGAVVSYGYDLKSQKTSITYPGNLTESLTYDDAGRVHTITDWLQHTTTYNYDADSNNTGIAYPNTTNSTLAYDNADRPTSITDQRSGTTFASFTYGRDNAGLVTSLTPTGVSQSSETYGYTTLNQLSSVNATSYTYDAADNATQLGSGATASYDAANEVTTVRYDTRGNRVAAAAPYAAPTTYRYDQANRLIGAQAAVGSISAAANDTISLKSDGTVWDWGANANGEVGNNSTTDSHVPAQASALANMTAVAAGRGGTHSLALRNDGTVWAWGANASGQLGNNSTTDSHVPIQVPGLGGAIAIAAGTSHSLALKSDGTVWAWGANASGQLGINSTTTSKVPVQVNTLTGVIAVAAGGNHSLALKSDGTVWAWGNNSNGQLGNNTTTNSLVPVQVNSLSNVTAISGGTTHSLAVKSDGTLWAWGNNSKGQLGNNSTTDSHVPIQVTSLTSVVAAAAGATHSVALKADGTVWDWGYNHPGQLGNNSTTDSHVPIQVTAITSVRAISAGDSHTVALKSDGTEWAWGSNSNGQLGNNSTTTSKVPVQSQSISGYALTPVSTFTYNGDGLRTAKSVSGGTAEQFVWDTTASAPELLVDSTTDYIYGPNGAVLEQISGSNVDFYHEDVAKSVRVITDATGAVVGTATFDAFGRRTNTTGSVTSVFGFGGEYTDAETGFLYLRARYYDPSTAQFITRDPLGAETQQPYSYANNNPISLSDPTGLDWWNPASWSSDTWGVIGTTVAVVGVGIATAGVGDVVIGGAVVTDVAASEVTGVVTTEAGSAALSATSVATTSTEYGITVDQAVTATGNVVSVGATIRGTVDTVRVCEEQGLGAACLANAGLTLASAADPALGLSPGAELAYNAAGLGGSSLVPEPTQPGAPTSAC